MNKNQKVLSKYIQDYLEILLERKVPKISKNWAIFWDKGISSWKPTKEEIDEILVYIQQDVENTFFCGDTYSLTPGWIEGAIESSMNVIREY